VPVSGADLAVAVRINRLDQVLSKIEALGSQVVPGFTADQIKTQIGNRLGDPVLAGLDQTRSILVLVFDPTAAKQPGQKPRPAVAALLPVTSDQYKIKFQAMGMNVYQRDGGKTLLVAQDENGAVAGRQVFDQLEGTLAQPLASDLNVYVNIEMLMTRHGAELDAGINQMTTMMDQMQKMAGQQAGSPAAMLALELRAILSVAKEIKDLGFDVGMSKDGVDFGAIVRAKPATPLAKWFDQPTVPDLSLLGYVPGTGAIVGVSGGDQSKVAEFLAGKIDEVFAATSSPAVAQIKRAELKALVNRVVALQKGKAFDIMNAGGTGMGGVALAEVKDAAAYMNELKNLNKTLEAVGILGLYKSMGTEMTIAFKENVRNYAGVPIHQMVTDVNMAQMMNQVPPPMMAFIKMFTHQEYEIAVVGNCVVTDMGAKKMDAVIDALKAKKPLGTLSLNAQSIFPKEGNLYADIYPGRIAAWGLQVAQPILATMGPMGPEADATMAKFKALQTKPISVFLAVAQGKLQGKVSLPIDPVLKIKAALMPSPPAPPKAL
jgi:hypothetical protein